MSLSVFINHVVIITHVCAPVLGLGHFKSLLTSVPNMFKAFHDPCFGS